MGCLVIYGSSSTTTKEEFCVNGDYIGGRKKSAANPCSSDADCCGCCGDNDPPTCQPWTDTDCANRKTCASYISQNGGCPSGMTARGADTPCPGNTFNGSGEGGSNPWDCKNSSHPVNIGTCWGDDAAMMNCGGNGQAAYEMIQHHGQGGSSHCETNPADCGPEIPYGSGGKWAWEIYMQLCGLKPEIGKCSTTACCDPNPTCSSSGITCPYESFMPAPNNQCADSTCDNTPGGECCQWNPTCPGDICNATTQLATGAQSASGRCAARTCTPGECCTDRGNCVNTPCPSDLWDTGGCPDATAVCNNQGYCAGVQCQTTECCTPDPNCTTFTCPPYYSTKQTINPAAPSPQELKCGVGEVCNTGDCCALNPLCSSFTCPQHEELKTTAAQIRCIGPTCTPKECCGLDPKCDSFECTKNSFYHTYQPISDAANTWCVNAAGDPAPCTESQCCTATPTYALAEVKTWPLYPE